MLESKFESIIRNMCDGDNLDRYGKNYTIEDLRAIHYYYVSSEW